MYSLDRDYLEHLFPQESPKPFYRYFGSRSVTMVYEKACLLSGQSIQCQAYTDQEIADLRDQVRFKILEGNKECYRVGDEVSVSLELKNVDVLEWKLFELNTRVSYEKNSSPISTTIDLDHIGHHALSFACDSATYRDIYLPDDQSSWLLRCGLLCEGTEQWILGEYG